MAADKDRGASGSAEAEIGKYLDILAKDPSSRVFAPLAEAYRKAGLLDDAIQTALEGLKVHPNYLGGRVALARAYFEKKQLADAAAEMEKVVRSAPDNLMAHKVLGQVAWAQGDLRGAEKAFRMVLMIDPRDGEAKGFLEALAGGARPAGPAVAAPPPPPSPPEVPATPAAAVTPLEGLELHNVAATIEIVPPAAAPEAQPPAPPPEPSAPAPPVDLEILPPVAAAPEPPLEPLAAPPPPSPQPPPVEPITFPEELTLDDIAIEMSEAPEVPEPAPPAVPAREATLAAPAEVEVFTREPWGPASPAPPPTPHAEDSPFEVFGRPRRGGPPPSTKGEAEAFREIELEPTAHAPVEEAAAAEGEGIIEVFTREPRLPPAAERTARERTEGRSEGGSFREIELEPTAYRVPEPPPGEAFELPLEEEIPRIDLTEEVERAHAEPLGWPEAVPAGEPEAPAAAEAPSEPEVDRFGFPDEVPPAEPGGEAESPPLALAEEIPRVDLAAEVEEQELATDATREAAAALEEPEEELSEPPGGARGMFNTETLAAIYTSQGFHERAAEVYRGLLAERPGDRALAAKLAEALARAGAAQMPAQAGAPGPAPPPPPAPEPAPPGGGAVERLEALMNAFRSRRGTSR